MTQIVANGLNGKAPTCLRDSPGIASVMHDRGESG